MSTITYLPEAAPSEFSDAGGEWRVPYRATAIAAAPVDLPRPLTFAELAAIHKEIYDDLPALDSAAPSGMDVYRLSSKTVAEVFWSSGEDELVARGILRYAPPTPSPVLPSLTAPTVGRTFSSSLIQTTTDRTGDTDEVIETTYDGVTMAHEIDAFEITAHFSRSRPENRDPETIIGTYAGAVNSLAWRGYAQWTVLCTGIDGDPRKDGAVTVWDVNYNFEYRASTWFVNVVHEDPLWPGRPLPFALRGPGTQFAALPGGLRLVDFNALDIPT